MRSASTIRRIMRSVLAASIIVPSTIGPVIACTGGPGELPDPSDETGGAGSCVQGECRPAAQIDAPACGRYIVPLTGDCSGLVDAALSSEQCEELCGSMTFCRVSGTEADCFTSCGDGRRYDSLDDTRAPSSTDIGSYLARMAFFEAASVDAFALLASDLRRHGAPTSLIRSSLAARRDEIRHARMAATLARRHGGAAVAPPAPRIGAPRSLEDIAVENAVEGCVRETFGVLLGLWQAEHAETAELRAFFGALATDESRHAALAMRVDAWLRSRLSESAIERVDAARERALVELEASLAAQPLPGLGLPSAAQAKALLATWLAATTALAA